MNSLIFFKSKHLFVKGFTLVELLVVVAIISLMLTLAANSLRGLDKSKGVVSGVDLLNGALVEAREIAKGRATWTRVVIPITPMNRTKDSRHLSFAAVMVWEPDNEMDLTEAPMSDDLSWKMISKGVKFPDGIYFSDKYSTLLPSTGDERAPKPINSQTVMAQISGGAPTECYYVEFDKLGRMTWPRGATRLVLMSGVFQPGKSAIMPNPKDETGKPSQAAGLAIFPQGQISRLQNSTQIFDGKPNPSR